MPSYFPTVILAPSQAKLVKGPKKQSSKHPWKSMKKKKRKAPRKLKR